MKATWSLGVVSRQYPVVLLSVQTCLLSSRDKIFSLSKVRIGNEKECQAKQWIKNSNGISVVTELMSLPQPSRVRRSTSRSFQLQIKIRWFHNHPTTLMCLQRTSFSQNWKLSAEVRRCESVEGITEKKCKRVFLQNKTWNADKYGVVGVVLI
jgi:hypothetical protein